MEFQNANNVIQNKGVDDVSLNAALMQVREFYETIRADTQEDADEKKGGFNIREAAEFIGTNHTTMCTLVQRDDFPAFRIGRRWVIPKRSLIEWMDRMASNRANLEV